MAKETGFGEISMVVQIRLQTWGGKWFDVLMNVCSLKRNFCLIRTMQSATSFFFKCRFFITSELTSKLTLTLMSMPYSDPGMIASMARALTSANVPILLWTTATCQAIDHGVSTIKAVFNAFALLDSLETERLVYLPSAAHLWNITSFGLVWLDYLLFEKLPVTDELKRNVDKNEQTFRDSVKFNSVTSRTVWVNAVIAPWTSYYKFTLFATTWFIVQFGLSDTGCSKCIAGTLVTMFFLKNSQHGPTLHETVSHFQQRRGILHGCLLLKFLCWTSVSLLSLENVFCLFAVESHFVYVGVRRMFDFVFRLPELRKKLESLVGFSIVFTWHWNALFHLNQQQFVIKLIAHSGFCYHVLVFQRSAKTWTSAILPEFVPATLSAVTKMEATRAPATPATIWSTGHAPTSVRGLLFSCVFHFL